MLLLLNMNITKANYGSNILLFLIYVKGENNKFPVKSPGTSK